MENQARIFVFIKLICGFFKTPKENNQYQFFSSTHRLGVWVSGIIQNSNKKLRSKEVTGSGIISASLPRLIILGFLLAFSFVLALPVFQQCILGKRLQMVATLQAPSCGNNENQRNIKLPMPECIQRRSISSK